MPSPFFSLSHPTILTWAGAKIYARGKSYVDNVVSLGQLDNGHLLAIVEGSDFYVTAVELSGKGRLSSICSCPHNGVCKHAVAVVLTAIERDRAGMRIPPIAEITDEFRDYLDLAEMGYLDGEEDTRSTPAPDARWNHAQDQTAEDPMAASNLRPELPRAILELLAVNLAPLAQTDLERGLRQPQMLPANAKTSRSAIAKALADLHQAGLAMPDKTGWICDNKTGLRIAGELIRQNRFVSLAKLVQRLMPFQRKHAWLPRQYSSLSHVLRDLRLAILEGNPTEAVNNLLLDCYQFIRSHGETHPFVQLFDSPFDAEYLLLFPWQYRPAILGEIFVWRAVKLLPVNDIVSFLQSPAGRPENLEREVDLLLLRSALRQGRLIETDRLLAALSPERRILFATLEAWRHTLAGNDQESIRLFETGISLFRRETGQKKGYPNTIDGIFPLYSLVRPGTAATIRQAEGYLALIDKDRANPLARLTPPLKAGINLLLSPDIPNHHQQQELFSRSQPHPMGQILALIADYWRNQKAVVKYRADLESLRDRALAGGYQWHAFEAATLLAKLGVETKKNTALAEDLAQQEGLVSLLTAVTIKEPWERVLQALLNIAEKTRPEPSATGQATDHDQRLIWLFQHARESGAGSITPKLQNLRKNGTWSKGRAVALKSLSGDNNNAITCLTGQDRMLAATIDKHIVANGWYGAKDIFAFNLPKTFAALVGHPLIFLEDAPDVRIDLVAGEPELRVIKKKNGIELALIPPVTDSDQEYWIIEDTPTRFKVVQITDQHRQIGNILRNGVHLPEKSGELAARAISSLSSLINVQSDLATIGDAEEVSADPQPHIHLLPDGAGLRLSFLVRPLATAEVWHRPGHGGQSVFAEVDGRRLCARRDLTRERQLAAEVINGCPTLSGNDDGSGDFRISAPEDCLELLLQLRQLGDKIALHWPQGERFALKGQASGSGFSLKITKERNWFAATGSLAVDDGTVIDLQQLLAMLDKATGRFIPLDDGGFLALTKEFRDRLEELRDCSDQHGKGVRFNPAAVLPLDGLLRETGAVTGDRHWLAHQKRLTQTVAAAVPSTLHAELRDYQLAGFRWLAQLSHWQVGACLADDMGLGKTIQALAAILLRAADGPTLVVAPLSVLMNWQNEAARFAPTLNVIPFGPGNRQETMDQLKPFDLVLCSYGLLPLEGERLAGVAWQTVVLDEAQAIKNQATKRSQAAMKLTAAFRLITTGTPVENHLGELWTLFSFLNPGLLGSHKQFGNRFVTPIEKQSDRQPHRRLRRLIRPFILRRLKSEVLQELPPRTEITLHVEMSNEETALYEAQRRLAVEALAKTGDDAQQQQFHILAAITRLRRLCCNPALVLPTSGIASSKLKVFGDVLDELLANQHKALVFSQFVDHLKLIRQLLDQRQIRYQYLDGSTPVKERKKRIDAFQAGEGDVFLISLKAGGSGLNLTAADYVIHMDPWWNPAVEDQASDRAHRIGQSRPVTIYRLVVKNSIEEEIVRLHRDKRDLADGLLAGSDIAGRVSAEELLQLLRGAASPAHLSS